MLYDTCVVGVTGYCATLTGYVSYASLEKLQVRAIRTFLGLPKNSCSSGVTMLIPKFRTQISMIRQYHRVMKMSDNRLTK